MKIKTTEYCVHYDDSAATVECTGSLRLSGEEYAPIFELLKEAASLQTEALILDLQGLEFLNSSGINVLSKFVINVRQNKMPHIQVVGAKSIPWQGKSLKNLQRLLPTLGLELK